MIISYNQKDPKWAEKKLGKSNHKIKDFGCVVCSLAALCIYYGFNETPETLAIKLKFNSKGEIDWHSLSTIYPQIKYVERVKCATVAADVPRIDTLLESGLPLIIETRHKHRYQHWVIMWEVIGGKHLISDSLYGDVTFFEDRYGSLARWIYGWAHYQGEKPLKRETLKLLDRVKRLIQKL